MKKTLLSTIVLIALSGAAHAGGEPEAVNLFDFTQVNPTAEEMSAATEKNTQDSAPEIKRDKPTPTMLDVDVVEPPAQRVVQQPKRKEVAVDMFSDDPTPTKVVADSTQSIELDPVIEESVDTDVVAADLFEVDKPKPAPVEAPEATQPTVTTVQEEASKAEDVQRRLLTGQSEEEISIFEAALMEKELLSPDEIRAYKKHNDAIAAAKAEKPHGEPVSNTRSVNVSLAPGAPHPEIRVSDNYVTSVVVLDSLGNPWPIKGYAVGNAEAFRTTAAGDNILIISPLKPYATGNVVITLKDKTVPVVFQIRNNPDEVDFRLEARVQSIGPESTYDPNMDLAFMPGGEDKILQSVLDGIPDPSLTELEVTGGSRYTQGWVDEEGSVYLRTPYELKVPEVRKQSKSSDGTRVFVFDSTPVATLSVGGKPVLIDIKERDF